MKKTYLFWIIAIFITLSAAYYQRKTGPTYPKKYDFEFNQKIISFSLPRSHGGTKDCPIEIDVPDTSFKAIISYKRYPTNEDWQESTMKFENNKLVYHLPNQPPAGKLIYSINILKSTNSVFENSKEPIIVRFKGDVPAYVLIPHILFMFIAMLLSNLSGLMAAFKHSKYRFYGNLTFMALLIGGMILGPIVQKFAFGEYWTGVPFGWDLTDNKTLIAFLFWIFAVVLNYKKDRPYLVLIASIMLLLVYSIPHSMFGSELDYSSGTVTQG